MRRQRAETNLRRGPGVGRADWLGQRVGREEPPGRRVVVAGVNGLVFALADHTISIATGVSDAIGIDLDVRELLRSYLAEGKLRSQGEGGFGSQ